VQLSNLELASKVVDLLKLPSDLIAFVEDRKGHDFRYSVDSLKIRKLGFVEQIPFEVGLQNTINWYNNNIDRWWQV
jgi:dTDP-glucose 4,6-dehydratase